MAGAQRRDIAFWLRRWLVPAVAAGGIAGAGIFAGYASTEPVTTAVPAVAETKVAAPLPTRQPVQQAPRVNAVEGTVIRLGRTSEAGRVLFVQDRAGRVFQVLVTPETVVKRAGRLVRPTQVRLGDQIVGVGARQPNGQFKASGVRILPPLNEPTQ
ncbi:MAG: hypothetical protein RMM58_03780 [Chloroflexota bacterium]|nr:hypothetical protein [Dehalococcoidia bacterium]MDW8252981.1 hypothetical protein [Chloroflexota bacterium]